MQPTLARMGLAAIIPLGLASCAISPAAGITVRDGSSVRLMAGQSARLDDGTTVHYARLVGDSRCPPGTQCVWAGDAEIELEWHQGHAPVQSARLHSNTAAGRDRVRWGQREIVLVEVARGSDRATLSVHRVQ